MDELSFLDGELYIRTPSNKMEGSFILYQVDEEEIESFFSVSVKEDEDISSFFSVRVQDKNDNDISFEIKYRDYNYLDASFMVIGSSYLDSFLEVRPHNRMFGSFELLPPIRKEKFISSTEDSAVRSREDLITINYGDSQKMMVRTGVEYIESFIKFGDLALYLTDLEEIEYANLRLYYTGDFVTGTSIELYLPVRNWTEYGVTYANRPQAKSFLTNVYYVDPIQKYIEFELKDLVHDWIRGTEDNFGAIIRTTDIHSTSFYTREGTYKPVVNIKYISNDVPSLGRAELESTMFIWGTGKKEINVGFEVHSDYGFELLDSSFYVHRPEVPLEEDIDSTFVISKETHYSTLTIHRRENEYLESVIAIQERTATYLDSAIATSKPDQIVLLTVDPNISLHSMLSVARNDLSELESILTISTPDRHTTIDIRKSDTLDVAFAVSRTGEEHLDLFFAVTREAIESSLYVRYTDAQEAVLTVNRFDQEELEVAFAVSREFATSSLYVKHTDSQDVVLSVNRFEQEDFESYFAVSRDSATSSLYVKYSESQDAYLTVVRTEVEYLDCSFAVSRDTIISGLHVRAIDYNEIHFFLGVARYDEESLDSYFSVTRPEVRASLQVKVREDTELLSSFAVRRTEISDFDIKFGTSNPDLISGFTVKYSDVDEIEASLEVPYYDFLDTSFTVHNISELHSTFDVRQFSEQPAHFALSRPDMRAILYVRVQDEDDFELTTQIRQRDVSDLNSMIIIRANLGVYYFII